MIKVRAHGRGFGIALCAVALLSACGSEAEVATSSGGGHGSRAELFESTSDLAENSSDVVIGVVLDQAAAKDVDETTEFTLSTIEIQDFSKSESFLEVGSQIVVRQLGGAEETGPAPLMEPGGSYLLYLTPSGLDGELASQFYITGGSAGLYADSGAQARSANPSFVQLQPEDGEDLPTEVSLDDSLG